MTLGRTLRDAREASRMSIEALSELTNIRIGLLSQMEADSFKNCGGDTYARGHLRNIAIRIGINPQILIDLYNEEHAAESQRIQDSLIDNNVMQVPRESKRLSWKIPILGSLAILAVIGLAQIIISNQSTTSTPKPGSSASASHAPTAPTVVQGAVSLVISASRGDSFIDIIVDGTDVEKGRILEGETKTYKGTSVISIYFSNPAALDVTLNGNVLPPLGGQNEEVRRTFR
jgi:cytoskeleton protein RodZ